MVSHCVLISIILMDNDAEYFHAVIGCCISLRNVYLSSLSIFELGCILMSYVYSIQASINTLLDIIRLAKIFPFYGFSTLFTK